MTETDAQIRIFGYARVSTYGQTLDVQLEQLKAARCAKVYREKATGVRLERRELQHLLRTVTPGDVVTVTRIDRLAHICVLKRIHYQASISEEVLLQSFCGD